ncbi:unnamed protein product [Rhizopus stolonifer]
MPTFGKNVELKINISSEEIVLLGHPQEAAGKLLQGQLTLKLLESTKIKVVRLSFSGRAKVAWSDGSGPQHDRRVVIEETKEFFKNNQDESKKLQEWNAGHYSWPFEFQIPGNLPQAFKSDEASISYTLNAVVERKAFYINTTAQRDVKILRSVLPSDFELTRPLEMDNSYGDMIAYSFKLPSNLYAFGNRIPINFKIIPMCQSVRLKSLIVSIKEYSVCKTNSRQRTVPRFIRVGREIFDGEDSTDTSKWEGTLYLEIPGESGLIQADIEYALIDIYHKLKLAIALIDSDDKTREIRCEASIRIAESLTYTQELGILPPYSEIWRSVPYNPSNEEFLRYSHLDNDESRPPPLLESSQSVPVSRSDNPSGVPWWDGVDLGKVPSYTAVGTHLIPSSFPPDYDSEEGSPEIH